MIKMGGSDKNSKSSNELAQDRNKLAKLRNELAESRTLQAAERTYAAWIRTGFTIAGAGWTLGTALRDSESQNVALLLGGALIILGLMCFVYAWFGFKAVFDYLRESSVLQGEKEYPFTMNLTTVTILSVTLFIIFVVAFGLIF
ncbi:DUF202 domain-containing protein [Atopococcus tabaci]|uniref:DUF202 domain-containing protein n=1 Tax=Atopococcus tabaci TaxID=269774 RepID=UPI00240A43C1|nr:DUF202 domain-containing protein [Atopococcus tabaci]